MACMACEYRRKRDKRMEKEIVLDADYYSEYQKTDMTE